MNNSASIKKVLDDDWRLLLNGEHHDPLRFLGIHQQENRVRLQVFRPSASRVFLQTSAGLSQLEQVYEGCFRWISDHEENANHEPLLGSHPEMVQENTDGSRSSFFDPYTFFPEIDNDALTGFSAGTSWQAYRIFGAHRRCIDGIEGVRFSVWAPNAGRVSVVGDFDGWDGRVYPMQSRGGSGVWEIFIPGLDQYTLYKYEIRNRDSGQILIKADPFGQQFELRPNTASVVNGVNKFEWHDQSWLDKRSRWDWLHSPMSVYELHLGSWQRDEGGGFLNYRELASRLVPYVKELGFTHVQLMPVTEHPFDGSWGYQVTGYFAPTRRFGSADDFRYLVNHCHENNIGVLLDWVPAHFPRDEHALANFDGTALFEHDDPQKGEHRDWGTLIFNYGRSEVKSFLLSSAFFWLDEFHIDGLRVDAVASMIYLDYSRDEGEWTPNKYGGRENLEAVDFLRQLNNVLHEQHPGALVIAEESTSWPMVSRPVYLGGLGFSMKWNMGWMNDTLAYFQEDPIHRPYHHDKLTFSLLYAFTENFVLPFSHDEVVHGKRSLLNRMPGSDWQRFANLRLLYFYMYTHPGKKLMFMGSEFAQGNEWNHDKALDWQLLDFSFQQGVKKLVADLNHLYRDETALHRIDFGEEGFQWLDCHDHSQSVISFLRRDGEHFVVVILNFTPVPRHDYRIGVPESGCYSELLNSDSIYYRGSNISNGTAINTQAVECMGQPCSLSLTLPPLAGIVLKKHSETR
ncbi:MAG: 1,4-alpha-glucan branching protein GlgB [Pseudomonadales bacterium]|nr:1,4-alpha-glucan branching protein GlgB [Pseudomonadales bacterium]